MPVVETFLQNAAAGSNTQSSGSGAGRRLFIWTTATGDLEACADGDQIPKQARTQAALVFCHNVDAEQPVTQRQQLQCMTLATAVALEESGGETKTAEDAAAAASPTTTTWLAALQMYTRQTFLPTIQAVLEDNEGMQQQLQDKLRQLDVALQQTSRSTRLPHVVLNVPRVLEDAVESHPAAAEKKLCFGPSCKRNWRIFRNNCILRRWN